MADSRNKETIHATVSPILKAQAEELVKKGDYSSISDVVSAALTEFFHARGLHIKVVDVKADGGAEAHAVS